MHPRRVKSDRLLVDKLAGHLIPVRFILFALVGSIGLVAHLAVMRIALTTGKLGFEQAQATATAFAIIGNFVVNNSFTFRDQRLRGAKFVRGLVVFSVVCSVGALANLGIASLLVSAQHQVWWTAGLAGAAMSLVWNYAVGSTLTWRRRT